ncbi:MAG: hypothetical protein GY722_10810 [bacterium]|nr:hypothetical protein [bacterium]
MSPELAAEEQRRLRTASQNLTRPPDELGCVASIGLILAGSLTAALIAGTVGNIVDSQPCTGSVSDCGEYVGIATGFWVFLLAAPIVSSVYIWLAGQSLEDKRRSYERSTSQRSSD